MSLEWLALLGRDWADRFGINRDSQPRSRRTPCSSAIPAMVQTLEERAMLAAYTVINTLDSGTGSLRWAIQQANATTGADTISFRLAAGGSNTFENVDSSLAGGDAAPDVFVIRPLTALPALTDTAGGTFIDGRSQTTFGGDTNPFGPEVVIDGSRISSGTVTGLQLGANTIGNRVEGLVIQNFTGDGLAIVRSDDNVVAGNYIGTDATGTLARGNGRTASASAGGILLSAGADGNVIGANGDGINETGERNLISGNRRHGIRLQQGAATDETRWNQIRGNYIGTNASGQVVGGLGNATWGIEIVQSGGGTPVYGNLVRGNVMAGNVSGDIQDYSGTNGPVNTYVENGPLFAMAKFASGILTVSGTEKNDILIVYQRGTNIYVRDVLRNVNLTTVAASQVSSVVMKGGGGDDWLDANGAELNEANTLPISVPVTFDGGGGNDTLLGGNGNDTQRGGVGNDTLRGAAGNDTLQTSNTELAYTGPSAGTYQLLAAVPYNGGMLTAFSNNRIYFSPDGKNLGYVGAGSNTTRVHDGTSPVVSMMAYNGGVITAFADNSIYFSRDGLNLGTATGNTTRVYTGTQRVVAMVSAGGGVVTAFSGLGIYFSPDGANLVAQRVYTGSQSVRAMIPYKNGVLTAFSGGGIFFSPDGRAVAGGTQVYNGTNLVVSMLQYGSGVLTAFANNEIYHSRDGLNLGTATGNTTRVYNGYYRVVAWEQFRGGVLASLSNGDVYFTPDAKNFGGGGNGSRAYFDNGLGAPTLLRAYKGGVFASFSDNNVYYSSDGVDLGRGRTEYRETLEGGAGNDTLRGGVNQDTFSFDADTQLGSDTLADAAGLDSIFLGGTTTQRVKLNLGVTSLQVVNPNLSLSLSSAAAIENAHGGSLNDELIGNELKNRLEGNAGNDILAGFGGDDEIFGMAGEDSLLGDAGDDKLYGGNLNDRLDGGTGQDTLYGETGDDQLWGADGNDNLYGGAGVDTLWGDNGNDGLFGGEGIDTLTGGDGNDRFLDRATWQDAITDVVASAEATVGFENGGQTNYDANLVFNGDTWTDGEIEVADSALSLLHNATGNQNLLKFGRGNQSQDLTFVRLGAPTTGFSGIGGWNGDSGTIWITDWGITGISGGLMHTLLHEVGHNWEANYQTLESEFNFAGWLALSGWTQANSLTVPSGYTLSGDSDWWYLSSTSFVSNYARTNPLEDFAESFYSYLSDRGKFPREGVYLIDSKRNFFDHMMAVLRQT